MGKQPTFSKEKISPYKKTNEAEKLKSAMMAMDTERLKEDTEELINKSKKLEESCLEKPIIFKGRNNEVFESPETID